MKKESFFINRGFSLVEMLVAVSVFLIYSFAFFSIVTGSISRIHYAPNREKGAALAEEGLEAVRNIKAEDFPQIINGSYGLSITDGQFVLVDLPDSIDMYTRTIQISDIEERPTMKRVESEVAWDDESVSLVTYIADWSSVDDDDDDVVIESCEEYCVTGGYGGGVCRQNPRQCQLNNETYESEGDTYCPGPPQRDCCCQE